MITSDNITDEQIRELMVSPGLLLRNMCLVALSRGLATDEVRSSARDYCATRLNARAVADEQIHALYDADEIDHATWANALMHPDADLGVFARLRCAEILNARAASKAGAK